MVYQVTARKDYPKFGISKGEKHFVIKTPFQPVRRTKTKPKMSQVVANIWEARLYEIYEDVEESPEGQVDFSLYQDTIKRLNDLSSELSDHLLMLGRRDRRGDEILRAIDLWQSALIDVRVDQDDQDGSLLESLYTYMLESFILETIS
jgi:hypothetical protein